MTEHIKHINDVLIFINEPEDNYHALLEAKAFAEKVGFGETLQVLIATVVSELSTNIIRYANKGEVSLKMISNGYKEGIEIIAKDNGPGIDDIDKAFKDNYSTTKDSLGLGLSSLKRIMDEYSIVSEKDKGTKITARIWRNVNAY